MDVDRDGVADRDETDRTASGDVREREGMPGAAPLGVGVAAGAAAGAAAWGSRDDERDPESERIASAADFRDDVPTNAPPRDVYATPAPGSDRGMSDESAHETTQPATENDEDVSRDTESPRGEWGGPRDEDGTASTAGDGDSMTIIGEPEDFAATEPVMAADQSPPVEPTPVTEPDVREQYAAATSDGSVARRPRVRLESRRGSRLRQHGRQRRHRRRHRRHRRLRVHRALALR